MNAHDKYVKSSHVRYKVDSRRPSSKLDIKLSHITGTFYSERIMDHQDSSPGELVELLKPIKDLTKNWEVSF